ncbi:MAG: hypothetical protein IK016_11050 [Lachnospiraceae bacterium]|nr:hypothetical protein [Lachnospiraceae bacterium]
MITISMDEGGLFERDGTSKHKTNDFCFIGGVVFDDLKDEGVKNCYNAEVKREWQRIRTFFQRVCRETGANYPMDLHVNESKTNNETVGRVKEYYRPKLGEFLTKGTYDGQDLLSDDGKPRKGKYYVYAYVKSRKGKETLWSNLDDDGKLSNLYLHMTMDALSGVLFHNERLGEQKVVCLDLASRMYVSKNREILNGYIETGQYTGKYEDGIPLVSADFYRTSLAREMSGVPYKQKDIAGLFVRSITYEKDELVKEGRGKEFLYLADAVCTHLGYQLNYRTEPVYTEVIRERMRELCGNRHILFLYDDADTYYTQARDALERDELYHCLQNLYHATRGEGEAAAFYKKVWEPELQSLMEKRVNVLSFTQAVKALAQATQSSHRADSKLLYFYQRLEALASHVGFRDSQERAVLFDLYAAGARIYNHSGRTNESDECRNKSREFEPYTGLQRLYSMRNNAAVSICDKFKFEAAKAYTEETVHAYEMMMEIQELLDVKTEKQVDYGKCLSQLGQCYAFQDDKRAEEIFLKALSQMDAGTADYAITQSYLLHFYADHNEREKFEAHAAEYFGGKTQPEEQMRYIAGLACTAETAMRFAAYVFLKGLYHFCAETLPSKTADRIFRWEDSMKEMEKETAGKWQGHPILLIYKYIAMIALKCGRDKVAKKYEEHLLREEINEEKEKTLAVIRNHSILTLHNMQGIRTEEDEALCRESLRILRDLGAEGITGVTGEEIPIANLDRMVTFSFH